MKPEDREIDKELRLRGFLHSLLIRKTNEEKYIQFMHTVKKLTERLKGRKARGLHTSERWLTRADGSKLRLCIYRPHHLKKKAPGVMWLHGGGYAQGIPELFVQTYRRLIEARDCVIVAPDYRLSIEAPYPAALEDAYATLLWMKNHAKELSIRSDQLMVGGESAGGGLTAAVSMYARDKKEVNIAFQMPLYPMLDDRMETESARGNSAPVWNSKTNKWAWKLYLGDLYRTEVPIYAAPARATDYSNLPPTVTFVGVLDPFLDETKQFVKNLKAAQVPVSFEIFEGSYHGFELVKPKAKKSQKALAFFIQSFKYAADYYFIEQND